MCYALGHPHRGPYRNFYETPSEALNPPFRYGIMMKRQEFREKAEEIGFIKYR